MSPLPLQTLVARRSLSFAQTVARAHAVGSMNSLVRITRAGAWDYDNYEYDISANTVVYADPDDDSFGAPAGITTAQGPITMDVGDEPLYYDSATVFIPQSAPSNPRINDLVQVMACPDAEMIGRFFRITSVPVGGRLSASIALACMGVAPSRENTPAAP